MVLMSGAGNTTVVLWSTPMSTRLWRLRSCKASGWAIMMSEAAPSWSAASCSPSAAMILARFSRSASAWRAMARFMVSGSWMSLSSTRVTTTPPPLLGGPIQDLADVDVDAVGLGQRLV